MKRKLAVLATAATLGVTAMAAPAQARGFGWWGPGLAFGLAAGALTAGAIAASSPYYYGPGYGYYGPRYAYAPAAYGYYGGGPYGYGGPYAYGGSYAYYGGPYYYRHRYWHRRYW